MTRFSQLYIDQEEQQSDSQRMRVRLQQLYDDTSQYYQEGLGSEFSKAVTRECGVEVINGSFGSDLKPWVFFKRAELRDVLDGITIACRLIAIKDQYIRYKQIETWVKTVNRIFREENTIYKLGDDWIVHYYVDADFEISRLSSIEVLKNAGMSAACHYFESAYRYLDGVQPNTRKAIVGVFEAAESIAKQLTGKPKLDNALAKKELSSLLKKHSKSIVEERSSDKMARALGEWIDTCHFYRHSQSEEQSAPPSMETTVMLMQQGASYVRRLSELYLQENAPQMDPQFGPHNTP